MDSAIKRIHNAGQFLLDTGLLWEINRRVLHPLGLAMEVTIQPDGRMTIDSLWDCRDDPEGLVYDPDTFRAGQARFQATMEAWGNEKLAERAVRLGYLVQESPEG